MQIHLSNLAAASVASLLLFVSGCDSPGTPADDDGTPGDDDTADLVVDEYYSQAPGADADILFVVDNSCSMMEEQSALSTNFWAFAQHLVDTTMDYHIGITTLDHWEGGWGYPVQPPVGELYGSPRYIDRYTVDPVETFMDNMTMGDNGVGACEVGLEAIYRAFNEPYLSGYNDGFYRDSARLMVIVVSDEEEGSTQQVECADWASMISSEDFVPWFTGLKGPDWTYQVHFAAIVGDDPGGCASAWGDAERGSGYLEVVDALGEDHATFHSICDHDWMPVMDELGVRAAGLTTRFGLSHQPVEGTLQVLLDLDGPEGPGTEWQLTEDPTFTCSYAYWYDAVNNTIVFDITTTPPAGAELHVRYEKASE